MTTREALSAALSALSYMNDFYTTTQCDPNGEPLTYNPAEAVEKLNALMTQLDARNAHSAAKRVEKRDANRVENGKLFLSAVETLRGMEQPTAMADWAAACGLTTAKLSAVVRTCNDGSVFTSAKVKGKLMWSVVGE